MFLREDFGRMAEQLGRLKGRFLLSINDVPEVREIFGRFRIAQVTTTYSLSGHAGGNAAVRQELLVSNWKYNDAA